MQGYNPPSNLPVTNTWKDFSWDFTNRNLYKGTKDFNSAYWSSGSTAFTVCDDDSNFMRGTITGVYPNSPSTTTSLQGFDFSDPSKTWTISALFKGTAANQLVGITVSGSRINWQPQTITNGSYTTISWTFSGDSNALMYFRFESSNATSSNPIYFYKVKIEENITATPWTSAPEDPHNDVTLNNFAYNTNSGWIQDSNGYGLILDSVDDYGSTGTITISHPFNIINTITLEAFVNLADTLPMAVPRNIISRGNDAYRFRIETNGKMGFLVKDSTTTFTSTISSVTIPTNQLVHICATFNTSTHSVNFYINGALVDTQTNATNNIATTTTPVYIGTHIGASEYWKGIIYSARIYKRVLSNSEILTNYTSTTIGDSYIKDSSLVLDLNANKNTKIYGQTDQQGGTSMAIATGQITIIDYNDALSLTGYITSNIQKTQMYNPDNNSYTPDWTASPYLVLTPSLFILGNSSDIITNTAVTSVTWYKVLSGTETAITADSTHTYSGTKNQILTVKSNETAGLPGIDYMCKVIYHDASTNLDLTIKIPISFSRVVNGGGIADAVAWLPNGNIFKNGNTNSLTAQCDLWRSSIIDSTNVTYRWFVQDATIFSPTTLTAAAAAAATSVTVASASGMTVGQSIIIGTASPVNITAINTNTLTLSAGLSAAQSSGATVKAANYDVDAGSGWRLIPSDITNNITGVTTNVITVYNSYVTDIATFECIIKDTDSTSNSYNKCFKDTVTFIDQTDPIQITIASSGGDVFKNGSGSSTLTARVYQAGQEIDTGGTKYTYTWSVFDQNGNVSTFNGGASTKTGKSITVGDLDVNVKATFSVSIS